MKARPLIIAATVIGLGDLMGTSTLIAHLWLSRGWFAAAGVGVLCTLAALIVILMIVDYRSGGASRGRSLDLQKATDLTNPTAPLNPVGLTSPLSPNVNSFF